MNWDSAADAVDRRPHSNKLKTPLLPQHQVEEQKPSGSLSSVVSDEIFYGNGHGLKLVYNAKNDEDFERSLAEERERDIVQTTESIRKVNEVFAELGGLVESQQADINSIENQVTSANERTKAGVGQLDSAVKAQGTLNSCYVYLLVFFLFVLIVIMLFMFWDQIAGSDSDD